MVRHLYRALLVLVSCLLGFATVQAQTASLVRLSPVRTDEFPRIRAYLDARDAAGNPVEGLRTRDVTVLENGQAIRPDGLQALRTGVQFVVAINPGPALAIRDSEGRSRYDYLVQALQAWAERRRDEEGDTFSLLTQEGAEASHLTDAQAWSQALDAYQPDLRAATPGVELFSQALEMASDPTPQQGMARAVLIITPYLDQNLAPALGDLAARADQAGVRVFVWMVSSAELFTFPAAGELASLAIETGGEFFAFSGIEPLPDPDSYLEPLRNLYLLTYTSRVRSGGAHQVGVRLQQGDFQAESPTQTFELQLAPPSPVFVSPPGEIVRAPADGQEDPERLQPDRQILEILIEFPDGHPRDLARTTLYVDGAVAAENLAPPYERLVWDLGGQSANARRLLQVEAQDELGLTGVSAETPILIVIERPSQGVLTSLSRNAPVLAGAAILLAGSVLLLVLILGGRIRPRPLLGPRARRRRRVDPVTQPVDTRPSRQPTRGRSRLAGWTSHLPQRLSWPQGRREAQPAAYLAWYSDGEQPNPADPIPITATEITLGANPRLATVVLEDPSVEDLHARLRRDSKGIFYLADQGSVAGTWVNFTLISEGWVRLEDGDLIHIGRVGFCFRRDLQGPRRKARIIYREPAS